MYNEPMPNFLTRLSKSRFPYEPLITVEISKERLIHNLEQFKKVAPNGCVAPVLKSNAYGHGLFEVAKILDEEVQVASHKLQVTSTSQGASTPYTLHPTPFFIIDSYFEAVALRAQGIKTPLLIIGYTRPETILNSRLKNVAFTITSIETLMAMNSAKHFTLHPTPYTLHLKIDTGMRRQGILPEEIDEAVNLFKSNKSFRLEGLTSHLCDSDNTDQTFTKNQISLWNGIVKKFKAEFPSLKYIHLSATYGHQFTSTIEANVSRLGIGLYGLSDNESFSQKLDLKPVLEMKTIITGIKKLRKNETVGYGNTFKAENDTTIATIPVGYFEGLDRRLSNCGMIQIGPDRIPCPIIGRVSMNITIIDISKVNNVSIGSQAIVMSNIMQNANSVFNIAKTCGTITYEIVVKIPSQLKRVVVD